MLLKLIKIRITIIIIIIIIKTHAYLWRIIMVFHVEGTPRGMLEGRRMRCSLAVVTITSEINCNFTVYCSAFWFHLNSLSLVRELNVT